MMCGLARISGIALAPRAVLGLGIEEEAARARVFVAFYGVRVAVARLYRGEINANQVHGLRRGQPYR
eukprot:3468114-Lingulodinium_polyedra.AAC.1